ncbi:MAG: hypothetical protein GXX79_01650 [Actinomycetales bacterium]|nr:hypothetical protein [Actinomycetales bacterium]
MTGAVLAVASAAIGAVMATAALTLGPRLLRRVGSRNPVVVMATALGVYTGTLFLLWLVYLVLATQTWVRPRYVGGALLLVTLGWTVRLAMVSLRARVPVFGDPGPGDGDLGTGGETGAGRA